MDLAQSTQVIPNKMVTPEFGGILESYKAGQDVAKNRIALEQAQSGLESNKAVSAAMKEFTDANGNRNVPAIIAKLAQDPNASLNLPEFAAKLYTLETGQTSSENAKLQQFITKNSIAGQRLGPYAAMIKEGKEVSRDQIISEFAHLVRKGVFNPQEAAAHMATLPPKTGNPEKDRDALHNWINVENQATQTNAELFNAMMPGQAAVSTGGGTQMLNVNKLTGKSTPTAFIENQLAPGTKVRLEEGNPYGLPPNTEVILPNTGGAPRIINQGGINQSGMPQSGINPMQQNQQPQKPLVTGLAPTTEANLTKGNQIVTEAREKAAGIPTLRFNAGKIIEYAEKASTGTGGALLNDLKGNFAGLPFTGNTVTDFNLLGHNLAMQNAVLAKTPGINASDAGQKLAGEISGTTSWDKKSIIEATRTNRMMGEINDLFNQGVQKYAKSPEKAIDFQNKWNSVLDLDTIRLYDAAINKKTDPKAYQSVVDNLGGSKSNRFIDAAKHIDKINDLITKGQ
jgi:hypothetical protein